MVRTGLCVGSADLIGMLAPQGRFLALEVKRPGEKPTKEQALFLELVRKSGGVSAVVTSVEEALAVVGAAMIMAGQVRVEEPRRAPSVTCPDCRGTGRGKINTSAPENEDCDRCYGRGTVTEMAGV